MDLRNKLVASEAFSAYLNALILDGQLSNKDFEEDSAKQAYNDTILQDWYQGM
jgi:hypothetical protein